MTASYGGRRVVDTKTMDMVHCVLLRTAAAREAAETLGIGTDFKTDQEALSACNEINKLVSSQQGATPQIS